MPPRKTVPTKTGVRSTVRSFHLGEASDELHVMRAELDQMRDVLLGRAPSPIDAGTLTLMEVADAYFARAKEMEQLIHRHEAEGVVLRGSKHYKFRTGELRSFIEMAKAAAELGSRRVTAERLAFDMKQEGGY